MERDTDRRPVIRLLEMSREREKAQTQFYRRLAAQAEELRDQDLAGRLNDLHADEQHHLSRLTARLLELGGTPRDLPRMEPDPVSLEEWQGLARDREFDEVAWYEDLMENELDPHTRALIEEIVESERHHRDYLGGKWMPA
jgi:rubrerythrin